MKKTNILLSLVITAVLSAGSVLPVSASAASPEPAANDLPESAPAELPSSVWLKDSFSEASANFAAELLKKEMEAHPGENVLVGPMSVAEALAMTAAGAGGTTRQEMEAVLGNGETLEEYLQDLSSYMKGLESEPSSAQDIQQMISGEAEFHTADAVWLNAGIGASADPGFRDTLEGLLDAEIKEEAFTGETLGEINGWVEEKTAGMIPQILSRLDSMAAMCLVNAQAFEGEWEEPYKDTQIEEGKIFTRTDGTEQDAVMLYSGEKDYLVLGNAYGFRKNYAGGRFSFAAFLPEEGTTPEDLVRDLTGADFAYAVWNRQYDADSVKVRLPEFTSEYTNTLNDSLKAMGMPEAFTDQADFSGMLLDKSIQICVDEVIHKTYMKTDRKGTKAAAATAVTMKAMAARNPEPPKIIEINLDRPFLYAVIDNDTNIPLFIGVQNSL